MEVILRDPLQSPFQEMGVRTGKPGVGGGSNLDAAILAMFASGESGLGFRTTKESAFSDTAGTTPAAVNGIVKGLRSIAGSIPIVTQSADASCLKLRGTPTGPNLLGLNGDLFDAGNWILGAGWSIADGILTASSATSDAVLPSVVAVNGKVYQVSFVVTNTAGTMSATFGGVGGRVRNGAGTLDDWITATGTDTFRITGTGFSGTVSQIRLWAADSADVGAPYFLSGEGAQWLEASLSGFTTYPIAMAGEFGSWATSGDAGLFSVYEGYSDCKLLTNSRGLDWGAGVNSAYTGGAAQGIAQGIIADFDSTMLAEGDLIVGGSAANANTFGTKSTLYVGRGRPDLWHVDGRLYSGVVINRAFTSGEKIALRNTYHADHAVQCWGDSMTAGSGMDVVRSYPARLAGDINRQVENQGAGGQTSAQIRTRFEADTTLKDEWIQVLWMGTNDEAYINTWQPTLDNIAACVAGIKGDKRYLVASPVRASGSGNTKADLEAMDALLFGEYGDKFINIRTYLQSYNDGSVQDLADVADGVLPLSLRSDTIHCNDKGYQLVAQCIKEKLAALGWL